MAETQVEQAWLGREVVDSDGEPLGRIEAVYVREGADRPDWALVVLGILGTHSAYIPLRGSEDDGTRLKVGFTKSHIKDAPEVQRTGNPPTDEEVEALHDHYDLERPPEGWAEAEPPEEEDEPSEKSERSEEEEKPSEARSEASEDKPSEPRRERGAEGEEHR